MALVRFVILDLEKQKMILNEPLGMLEGGKLAEIPRDKRQLPSPGLSTWS